MKCCNNQDLCGLYDNSSRVSLSIIAPKEERENILLLLPSKSSCYWLSLQFVQRKRPSHSVATDQVTGHSADLLP